MKKLIAVLLLCALPLMAADQRVLLNVVVTNGTANGNTFTFNSDTRTATNNISGTLATTFLATNVTAQAATNLYRHLNLYKFAGPVSVRMTNETTIELMGVINQSIAFSMVGNWGYGVLKTAAVQVIADPVMIPADGAPDWKKTNWADGITALLERYALTNAVSQTSKFAQELTGTTNAQHILRKTIGDSSTSNTVHGGTFSIVSNGLLHSLTGSNLTIKSSTLTDTGRIATARMSYGGGDFIRFDGSDESTPGTNFLGVSVNGSPMLVVSIGSGNAKTNLSPLPPEIINYASQRALFPLYVVGTTNWWASRQEFTNIADNIRFWYGFGATNPVLVTPTLRGATNWGVLRFLGTNFTSGAEFTKDIILIGHDVRIGGTSGDSDGNMVIGNDIDASSDVSAPFMGIGRGLIITNGGKFAMGFDGVGATNTGTYAFFGTPTEDNEFRIADAQAFVRFKPPIKNLVTFPHGSNILNGDVSFPRYANSSLANGDNSEVDLGTNIYVRFSGPSAAYTISSFKGPRTGRFAFLQFAAGQVVTMLNDSGVGSPPEANRILTLSGADQSSSGGDALGLILYDDAAARWIFAWLNRGSGSGSAGVSFDSNTFSTDGGMVVFKNSGAITNPIIRTNIGPSSPAEGQLWHDVTFNDREVYMNTITQTIAGVLYKFTNTPAYLASTTQNSILGAGRGSTNLPANFFRVGKYLKVVVEGTVGTDSVSPGTLTMRLKFGAVEMANFGPMTLGTSFGGNYFRFETITRCHVQGGSATWWTQGEFKVYNGTGFTTLVLSKTATDSTSSAVAITVDVTAQQSVADADNKVQTTHAVFEHF
jgi:hypothetical protein